MKQVQLRELLEKYYSALTTHEEEQILLEMLSSDELSPEFFDDRDTLLALIGMAIEPEPDSLFESRMEAALFPDAHSLTASRASDKPKFRKLYIALLSSAAVVLLAVSGWLLLGTSSEPADSFSSPEIAYEETLRTLQKISSEMNRATSKLKPLESIEAAERGMRNIGETGRLIDMGLTELETVQKTLSGKELTNN